MQDADVAYADWLRKKHAMDKPREYRLCNHPDEDHEWQDAMRARQTDPVKSDYSSEGRGGSPVPSLQRMLTALYQAEVDFNITSAWDAGIRVAVHKPRSDGWTDRGFSVGKAPHDFPTWGSMWDAVVFFICETVVRDWDNLEDGAPVDIGCLDCTMNTTPVNLTTGDCVYHIAKHVLTTHGLPSRRVSQNQRASAPTREDA